MAAAAGRHPGGTARLRALIDKYAEAIEADFQRFYGLHIGLIGTEELTYGRFRTLLFALPRESLFMQETLGEPARWSTTDYLLANVLDAVSMAVHALQSRWRRKGSKAPRWKPFPRPGDKPDPNTVTLGRGGGVSVAEMRERLDRRRRGE